MSRILLLGSQSFQRRELLKKSLIPFALVYQDADESQCDWGLTLPQLLESIAIHKMNHVLMPEGKEGDEQYVLTVDTMVQNGDGVIYGKPANKEVAVMSIKSLRDNPGIVGTAFCLDKKIYSNGAWHVSERILRFVSATYVLDIPDHWIEIYCDQFPEYLTIAGALTIEEFGAQFIQSINGSYSTAVGLPLYELREALESIGFFY